MMSEIDDVILSASEESRFYSAKGALSLNPGELPWVVRNNSVVRPEGPR